MEKWFIYENDYLVATFNNDLEALFFIYQERKEKNLTIIKKTIDKKYIKCYNINVK